MVDLVNVTSVSTRTLWTNPNGLAYTEAIVASTIGRKAFIKRFSAIIDRAARISDLYSLSFPPQFIWSFRNGEQMYLLKLGRVSFLISLFSCSCYRLHNCVCFHDGWTHVSALFYIGFQYFHLNALLEVFAAFRTRVFIIFNLASMFRIEHLGVVSVSAPSELTNCTAVHLIELQSLEVIILLTVVVS